MQADDFLAEVEPVRDMWRWIDFRALGVREAEVGWRCDALRAMLVHDKPDLRTDLPETVASELGVGADQAWMYATLLRNE